MERKYKRQMIAIVTSAIAWMIIVISLIIQNQQQTTNMKENYLEDRSDAQRKYDE